jgi:hypothetical protein
VPRPEKQREADTKLVVERSPGGAARNSFDPLISAHTLDSDDGEVTLSSSLRPSRAAAFSASSHPFIICSLGKCCGCEGDLVGHVSSISCSRCSEEKSIAQVIADSSKSRTNQDMELQDSSESRRGANLRKHRSLPRGGILGSDTGKQKSETSIPWSPAVSGISDGSFLQDVGSFLQEVYQDEKSRAVDDESPSKAELKMSESGRESESNSSAAVGEDQGSPSYFESPELMRASRTSSASHADVPDSSVKAPSLYGNRMDRAVKLMAALKKRLASKPELLESVKAILYAVIGNQVGVLEARQQTKELLSDVIHSDLLEEVLLFLPAPNMEDDEAHLEGNMHENDNFADGDLGGEGELNEDDDCGDAWRRQRKRPFSETEIENLVQGVKRFGFGKWRQILQTYVFDGRTAVNLKDAYRVIERRRWKETKRNLEEVTPSRRGAFEPSPGSQRRRLLPR